MRSDTNMAVLISIQPRWCELIASRKKTIEARKTHPKISTPFKCYIYCTKEKDGLISLTRRLGKIDRPYYQFDGKVIGEFVCDKLVWVVSHPAVFAGHDLLHEKAIHDACLTMEDAKEYASGKDVYGWHISDLVIYDQPRELCEFRHCGVNYNFNPPITRPPQSWCYVEEVQANERTS